jgi:hypothetical protein
MNSRYTGSTLFTPEKNVAQISAALAVGITIGNTNAVLNIRSFLIPNDRANEISTDSRIKEGTAIRINIMLFLKAS